jgi:purine-binding chemotaxis protein CheW
MNPQAAAPAAPAGEPGMPEGERPRREFLTCRLGAESYGIDILRVQEIREFDRLTRVPRVARFVRGVINLRGAIVPIVDLGLMFGFPDPIELAEASVIVLNDDHRLVGLAVTAVSDVVALADEEITPAPELGQRAIDAAISGIGAGEGASVLLLDVDHLLDRIREGAQ